jgi:hypothetical protein
MKKLSLLFGLALVFLSGCKKEDPIASTVKKVSIPQIVSYLDDSYQGIIGIDDFAPQVLAVDGFYGYAVDTIYGFNVGGNIVDTIWFTDFVWNGDTTETDVVSLDLIATNADGVSNVVSSDFVVIGPPAEPYLTDISGSYSRTSPSAASSVVVLERVVDGVYKVFNPAFSGNTCWTNADEFGILLLSADLTADFLDFDFGSTFACGNFGGFTVTKESFDPADNSFCVLITQLAFPDTPTTRCIVKD